MRSTSTNGAFPKPSAISKNNMASDRRQAAGGGDRRPPRAGEQRRALSRAVRRDLGRGRRAACCAATSPISARRARRRSSPRTSGPARSRCSACSATTITNAASPRRSCEILHEAGMTVLDEQAVEIEGVGFAGREGLHGRLRPRRAGAVRRADRQGVRRRGDERGAQAGERAPHAAHRAQRRRASLFADRSTRSRASRRRSSNISARSGCATRSTASTM